jgi:hypothetical protein
LGYDNKKAAGKGCWRGRPKEMVYLIEKESGESRVRAAHELGDRSHIYIYLYFIIYLYLIIFIL